MKKYLILLAFIIIGALLYSFEKVSPLNGDSGNNFTDSLRKIYEGPISEWPKPELDPDLINFQELGIVPESPLKSKEDSLKHLINLGKLLFFDPRLSGSGQISCSSCHTPSLGWADGRTVAQGHDHQQGPRNTPTILNVWFYNDLFWDGRSGSLEDQAFGPINSEIEMHGDFSTAISRLNRIKGYPLLFDSAFGNRSITPDRITHALATFQRTIVSRKSRFDHFLLGKKNALTDQEIRGLHFFRTQARCINCHNGPLFTDKQFHNIGLTYFSRKYEDLGRFAVTKNPEDVGKFKTPSLRDVTTTAPWMHNGLFSDLLGIVNLYNSGMANLPQTDAQKKDPMYPVTSKHVKPLNLTMDQREDIVAFLQSISTTPLRVRNPELPK
jgi:cytochrome c peroxidase